MKTGWIKTHRKILDNEIMHDPIAFLLLNYFMLSVDKNSGTMTFGRLQLAKELRLSDSTIYKAIKRLEKKYKMVTQSSNNRFTEITLLNWAKYQTPKKAVTQVGNNKVTTKEQQSNTLQEYKELKNKRILSKDNTGFGNPDINTVSSYFLEKLKLPKEDLPKGKSRQYWYSLLRESGRGVDGVKDLIDLASNDDFYRNNISSSMDLFYKRIKLIARKRGALPKIAVMPTRQEGSEHVGSYSGN